MRFSNLFTTALAVSMPVATIASIETAPTMDSPVLARAESHLDKKQLDLGGAVGELLDLVSSLKGLLNDEFFDDVQITVHGLADLLAAPFPNTTRNLLFTASGLLEDLSPLFDIIKEVNFKDLFDTIGSIDIGGLLDAVTSLLTPDTIKTLGSLLKRADMLLSPDFIKQTKGLIADAAPLVAAVSEFVTALISALLGG